MAVARGALGTGNRIEEGRTAHLTILFTDIEGSTALVEQLGDERWDQVLSAHDVVVRRALVARGGREIKTVGDGFLAVFSEATPAVLAGLDVQAGLRAVAVPGVPGGLRVRVGVHSGSVICRSGDVIGRNVNLARRITSAAAGGEVLVSSAVKALTVPHPALRDGQERVVRLRGIPGPQNVFEMSGRRLDPAAVGGTGTAECHGGTAAAATCPLAACHRVHQLSPLRPAWAGPRAPRRAGARRPR